MTDTAPITHFLMVANGSWAKRTDAREALVAWCKEANPKSGATVECRAVTEDAFIDGCGTLHATRIVKLPSVTVPKSYLDAVLDLIEQEQEIIDAAEDAFWSAQG